MTPVVQDSPDLPNDIEIVIPKTPQETLEEASFLKVPVMMGSTRDEGSLVFGSK